MDTNNEEPFGMVTPEQIEKTAADNKKEEVDEEYSEDDKTEDEDPRLRDDELFHTSPSEVNTAPNDMPEAFYASPDIDMGEPKYFRRADWGAMMPKWIESLPTPITRVAVSYTHTEPCKTEEECKLFVKRLQQQHLAEDKVPDIKHNFLIGGDGNIYEGRGFTRVGPVYKPSPKHIEDLNGVSIDIALIEMSGMLPPKFMVDAFSHCIAQGIDSNLIEKQFYTYYLRDNDIYHISPPCLDKDGKQVLIDNIKK